MGDVDNEENAGIISLNSSVQTRHSGNSVDLCRNRMKHGWNVCRYLWMDIADMRKYEGS